MVVRLGTPTSDNDGYIDGVVAQRQGGVNAGSVSYTHLTLPTKA